MEENDNTEEQQEPTGEAGEGTPTATIEETSFVDYRAFREKGELPADAAGDQQADNSQNTSEADEAESAGETDTPETIEDGTGKRRKPSAETRIREITRKRREAEAERDELKVKLEAATSTTPADKTQTPTAAPAGSPVAPVKPKAEAFETYEAFDEALEAWREQMVDFKVDKKLAERSAQDTIVQQVQTQAKAWESRSGVAREKHPDFDEALSSNTIELPEHVTQTLLESEQGPELAYYLATHDDELEAVLKKSPLAAIKAMGVIESKLAGTSKTKKVATSKAPAPPVPVGGGKGAATLETVQNFADYKKLRRQQPAP